MKSEITIQYCLPKNFQIKCRIKPTIYKKHTYKDVSNLQRCRYRMIPQQQMNNMQCSFRLIMKKNPVRNKCILTSHYKKYLLEFPCMQNRQSNVTSSSMCEEKSMKQKSILEQNKSYQSKKKQQRQQLLKNPIALSLIDEYRQDCSPNIMKNIKEAFIKYIFSINNKERLEKLVNNNMNYTQMKRKLYQIKQISRENKVIKIICKHPFMKILFKDFLEHAEESWLPNSKIQQKEQCLKIVKFLIKLIGLQDYIEVIEDYKK